MTATKLFYKYMPFDPNGSLRVITDGTIKFSNPLEFNDPFDCNPVVDGKSYEEEIKNSTALQKALCKKMGISHEDWRANENILLSRLKEGFQAGQHNKLTQEKLGVCCLTTKATNPLMWGHYADSHRGFVVEFQVPTTFKSYEKVNDPYFDIRLLAATEVIYVNQRPTLHAADPTDVRVNKGFFIKSEHWKYEEEYRVLSRDLGPGIHKFHRNRILSSVIAGCKMGEIELEQLKNAIKNVNQQEGTSIEFFHAVLSEHLFELSIPGHPIWDIQ